MQEDDITHLEMRHDDNGNQLSVVQDAHATHPITIVLREGGDDRLAMYSLSRGEQLDLIMALLTAYRAVTQ